MENEERRKALREDRGHTSREDRGHTSRNTWAYKRSRSGLQRRSPTKTNAREQATQKRDQGLTKRNVEQRDRGFTKCSVEQREPGLTQRGGDQRDQGQKRNVGFVEHNTPQRPQREQGLKQCGVQRENRAPAELSAWALNTHDLLWEKQDLRRENEDLRLRLHRLKTRLVILETIVDRKDKGDVQRTRLAGALSLQVGFPLRRGAQ